MGDGHTITSDGQPVTFTAVYWQYGQRCQESCGSVEDAIGVLLGGHEYNTLSVEAVLGPDDSVLLNADQVFDLIGKSDAEREDAITRWAGPRQVGGA